MYNCSIKKINVLLLIYLFINSLFIIKYTPNFEIFILIIYNFLIFNLLCFYDKINLNERIYAFFFFMFIIVFFLFTIYLNYSVDGNTLNVDRWSALENGAKALINGDYPYNFLSHMQHKSSNLPMLMILGLPFYFIFGSVGYLQSLCFLLFAFLIYKMFKSYKERLLILLLIVLSPSYVYEVYTKSDMMSNFIILLLGMYLILRNLEQKSAKKIIILGLFSSMLFLTRISSVIPLLLVLFYPFISFSLKNKLIFIISSLTTSIIILYIGFHNADNFSEIVKNNPFTVQATRQPLYITLSFVILSILLSFRIKAKSQYYSFSGLLLFMMIFIFFIISLLNYGLQNVISNSYFDISYFNMCMPFVIVSIGLMFFNNKRLKLWSL